MVEKRIGLRATWQSRSTDIALGAITELHDVAKIAKLNYELAVYFESPMPTNSYRCLAIIFRNNTDELGREPVKIFDGPWKKNVKPLLGSVFI